MNDISVNNLTLELGGTQILNSINFEVPQGKVHGFLGPNGAGKTTTMKCLLGLIHDYNGQITVLGGDVESIDIKKKIGFMAENTYLYKFLSGDEILDFYGSFFIDNKKVRTDKVNYLLDTVGLSDAGSKKLSTYSKGMLQRIGIAQALIGDPQLLFLDEPMGGLDPIGRRDIRKIILDLKAEGKTVFFNSHILSDVEEICDTFSILHKGNMLMNTTKISELDMNLEDKFMRVIESYNSKQ